jgi:putative transposase
MANYRRLYLHGYSYYFTIVTHKRNPILVENIMLLRESFRESKSYFDYKIDAIVVLPDHIHMVITPKVAEEYPKIIHAIKYNFSKRYILDTEIKQSPSRQKRKLKPIWQKRYYEHTIRDEKDYFRCLKYIRTNPVKHKYVENETEWKYSSFTYGALGNAPYMKTKTT